MPEVEEIAGLDGLPIEQLLDAAVERGVAQLRLFDRRLRPERDRRTGLGTEDQPAFVLAARQSAVMRLRVVGVDLYGQLFAGEQIFDQLIGRRVAGRLEPYFANRFAARRGIAKRGPQFTPPPGLFHPVSRKQDRWHQTPPSQLRPSFRVGLPDIRERIPAADFLQPAPSTPSASR